MTREEMLSAMKNMIISRVGYNGYYHRVSAQLEDGRCCNEMFICNQEPWIGEVGFYIHSNKSFANENQVAASELSDKDIEDIYNGMMKFEKECPYNLKPVSNKK